MKGRWVLVGLVLWTMGCHSFFGHQTPPSEDAAPVARDLRSSDVVKLDGAGLDIAAGGDRTLKGELPRADGAPTGDLHAKDLAPAIDQATPGDAAPVPDQGSKPDQEFSPDLLSTPDLPQKPDSGAVGPPTHAWSRAYGGTSQDGVFAVAADGSGNLYLTGQIEGSATFGTKTATSAGSSDIFLAKLDPAGAVLWVRSFGAAGADMGSAVAVDRATNRVYLAGLFQGTVNFGGTDLAAASADIVLASFDAAGNHLWSKNFGGPDIDEGLALAVDGSGNLFLTGEYHTTINFGGGPLPASSVYKELFLASFSPLSAHRWSKKLGTAQGIALAADPAGNIVCTGVNFGPGLDLGGGQLSHFGQNDVFVASYTNLGVHRWSKSIGGAAVDQPTAIATDASGNAHVVGWFSKTMKVGTATLTAAGDDGFIASFDSSGGHRWAKQLGGSGFDYAMGVAVDAAGDLWVGGDFSGTADFGGGVQLVANGNGYDIFIARYSPLGDLRWAKRLGGINTEHVYGLALDGAGNAFLAGYFFAEIDLGGGVLPAVGPTAKADAFVVKLTP